MATITPVTDDYQLAFNGLILGNGTPYDIVGINGMGFPNVRSLDIDRQDSHGSYPSRRELFQARTINIEMDVIATGMDDLWDKMSKLKRAFMITEAIRPLTIRFGVSGWGSTSSASVVAYGYVRQFTENPGDSTNYNTQKIYIQFECPDPRVYDTAINTKSTGPISVSGGWTFPWTFPWTFGSVTSGILNVTNTGNMDICPLFTFYGPLTSPVLLNINTGEFRGFNLVLSSSDYLVVDCMEKTALLNGTADRYNTRMVGSSWFTFRPGTTALQFSAAAGSGTMSVSWQSAWA